ncbi:hypothetical protein CMEL01_04492 [Colletotrichum melonis]|uniref:Uncharacterized protein n=1 Tax=Colletotrichum melonis TaxID=1209925 RepID=A0AAI9UEE2_9PEZI|nr:hypothetical protein CMEL01_04492 [Colletotrichum melonis]
MSVCVEQSFPSTDDDANVTNNVPRDRDPSGTDRRQSRDDYHANVNATEELTSIMTASASILSTILNTSSNPVSPGPSSPPLEQAKSNEFVPPTRPSSTPFLHPDQRNSDCCTPMADDVDAYGYGGPGITTPSYTLETPEVTPSLNLNDLPAEIHECILDHLFGYRVSTNSKSSVGMQSVTKSWGTALRHSRRRELSELALVSPVWRILIQERLYRHIKIKATIESLELAMMYFSEHNHLRHYVKHIEIWFPVFQPKYGPLALSTTLALPTVTMDGLTNATYTLPANNCSLEEAFTFVSMALPDVCVLTIEGGERKKAPKVQHSWHKRPPGWHLPTLHSVRTLVTKGQWNLMREDSDFSAFLAALPNLNEWHGSYSKPKSKSYLSMASILPKLPTNLTYLNLCLESDYRRELTCPPFYMKVSNQVHFCSKLAEATPALEHLAYTGRVCKNFFNMAAIRSDSRTTRLKTIDLTVKNCCRPVPQFHDSGSGIQDMNFIHSFEMLVLAGIHSMSTLKALDYLRIRFVDLDSPVPPLNPYFVLRDGWCSGVWSDNILAELNRVRPNAKFEQLSESFGEVGFNKDGRMIISPDYPRSRVLSLKLANYALLAGSVAALP